MDRQDAIRESARLYAREPLFQPSAGQIAASRMTAFKQALEKASGEHFADYSQLHAYSAREYRAFWKCFLESASDLEWSGSNEPVCIGNECETARFFPGIELNY